MKQYIAKRLWMFVLVLLGVSIASGQQDRYGIAQSIYSSVNLGASAAAAHSNALINLGFPPGSVLLLGGGVLRLLRILRAPLSAPALALCALM